MNEANFVKRMNDLVTGDIFLAEREIPLFGAIRDTDTGLQLGPDLGTGATAVTPTAVVDGLSFDDGETALLMFQIPQDYNPEKDKLILIATVVPSADSSDTTDLGLLSTQSIFRAGAAEDTTAASAVAESATASTGALVREVALDISGGGYEPGDVVQRVIDVNNGGTTELILVGLRMVYGSGFAAYNDDDRFRVAV